MKKKNSQKRLWWLVFLGLFIFEHENLSGQVSGSNRVEYQVGNLPNEAPESRSNLYNQLNLNYRNKNLTAGIRAEIYNVDQSENAFSRISQKYLRYRKDNFQLQIGNFYEILGKGLLLRAFDIPGVTYEDRGTRERYGFYQDIEGLSLRYRSKYLDAKLLNGYPLERTQPPTRNRKSRRPSLIQAGELNLNVHDNVKPGFLYLREDRDQVRTEYGGFNLQGYSSLGMQYYIEYVQNLAAENDRFTLGDKSTHAFYTSLNYVYNWLSLSVEYKDYHNFTLGYNEPPSLVKEHSFTLLNRSTHAVVPLDERGFQFEALFNLFDLNTATLNVSNSENDIFGELYTYYEVYADLNYYPDDLSNFKGFLDFSQDELEGQFNRITAGFSFDRQFMSVWNIMLDVQTQNYSVEYAFNPDANYGAQNQLVGITVSKSPGLSAGIVIERSDDDNQTSENDSFLLFDKRYWPGFTFAYNYNQNIDLSLFYGKRRGGNACTGGICYEVQPFEGIELRVSSMF
jgi:hypothetical protein